MSQNGKLPARSQRGFTPTDGTRPIAYKPPSMDALGMAIQLGQGSVMGGDSKLKGLIRGTMPRRVPAGAHPPAPQSRAEVELGNADPNAPVVVRIVGEGPDKREEVVEAEFPPGTRIKSVERIQ